VSSRQTAAGLPEKTLEVNASTWYIGMFILFSLKQMPGGVAALIPDTEHQIPLFQVL
jgi:hypothetical protein